MKTVKCTEDTKELYHFFKPLFSNELFVVPKVRKEDFVRVHSITLNGGKEQAFANGCNKWLIGCKASESEVVFKEFKTRLHNEDLGRKAKLIIFLD